MTAATALPATPSRPLVGILLVAAATLLFAAADVITKTLTTHHPVPLVMAVRYAVSLLALAALAGPRHGRQLWHSQRTGLLVVRGLVLGAASLTMGLALRVMPVGETVAIIYLAPFAVLVLSGRLLGERVGAPEWIGALVGFAGVLLILRPGGGLDPMGVTFALLNAACATAYLMMTRALTRTESTLSMLFFVLLVGTVGFGAATLVTQHGPLPDAHDLGLMAVLGLLALAGHFLFTSAYREAPAALLAPVNYLHLAWAGGLGLVVFGHMPDALTLAGMALVIAAGAGVALRAARA